MNRKTRCLAIVVALCGATYGWCGEGEAGRQAPATESVEVDLLSAAKSGQVQIAVVPQSYLTMTMRVRNNTEDTLRVLLPETFAAIPTARWQTQQALRQQGMPPSLANNYGPSQGGAQGLAGSLAGPWVAGQPTTVPNLAEQQADNNNNNNNTASAHRTWTLAAGQLIQIQVPCFCLEYGKPDPNPRIPYQMIELQDLNEKPAVQELLTRFARGDLDQRVAQLAAWHVANGVPWPMLAQVKFPRSFGRRGSGVSKRELLAAKQLSESLPSYNQPSSLGDR
ncbi:MAG: hypothetical protein ACYC0X_24385 [Pirellulaceae bacterium]